VPFHQQNTQYCHHHRYDTRLKWPSSHLSVRLKRTHNRRWGRKPREQRPEQVRVSRRKAAQLARRATFQELPPFNVGQGEGCSSYNEHAHAQSNWSKHRMWVQCTISRLCGKYLRIERIRNESRRKTVLTLT